MTNSHQALLGQLKTQCASVFLTVTETNKQTNKHITSFIDPYNLLAEERGGLNPLGNKVEDW